MHLFTAINALLILISSISTENTEVEPVNFRVQVYPYGGYYSYPPYCPPGYTYGPSYGYRGRGFSFYYGPGYRYGRGCYPYYGRYYGYGRYGYGRYGHHRRHHRGHHHGHRR